LKKIIKTLFTGIISLAMLFALSTVLFADSTVEFDKSNLSKGIVSIKYFSTENIKTKVQIQYNDFKYTYNIKSSSSFVNFPLQLGNGTYKIGVYEQVEGTKYTPLVVETIDLKLDDSSKVFLTSIQLINWSEKMNTVNVAKELTKNKTTELEKIEVCYQYMVKQFKYDYAKLKNLEYDYIPVIDDVVKKKLGICYDYAAVLSSMLRSLDIKSKLIMGYSTNVKEYHAWNEIFINGKWVTVDTTYDSQMENLKIKYEFEKPKSDYSTVYEY